MKARAGRGLKTNRLEEPSAELGPRSEASENDMGSGSTPTRPPSRISDQLDSSTSHCYPSCDTIMKCAAIALALQGASGLVAPRLTVKSSALNAATLEVKSQCRSTTAILAKAIASRLPPAQKPAGSGTDARALLPSQRCCKKPHHTHIWSARRRRTPGCKKAPRASHATKYQTTHQ